MATLTPAVLTLQERFPLPDHDLSTPARDLSRLGAIRRIDRCATPDGFLTVAAIDHPSGFHRDHEGRRQADAAVVSDKLDILLGLIGNASALLMDPVLGMGQAIATGALPGRIGLISNIELLRETEDGLDRTTAVRPGWTPEGIARLGADAVKFVFFHREEMTAAADTQRAVVTDLVRRCRTLDLPLIIEPLWYPLDGDPKPVGVARADAIIRAAVTFAGLGADILKLQFPGAVDSVAARADAAATVATLDQAIEVPWVLLSEGVGYDDFALQVQLASWAGASGFMAGRAVWGDASRTTGTGARQAAVAQAGRRLGVLTSIVRAEGRPWRERPMLAHVQAELPADWHRTYAVS